MSHESKVEVISIARMPDKAGKVLIALLSGGDYTPGGIPGCGVKLAIDAKPFPSLASVVRPYLPSLVYLSYRCNKNSMNKLRNSM